MKRFPDVPGARRALVVLSTHDIEKLSYADDGSALLDSDETHVVCSDLELPSNAHPALRNVYHAGHMRPGTLLVQSPFDDDVYEDADEASEKFAIAKHLYFSTLCGLLGAKEVKVEQVSVKTTTGSATLNIKAGHAGVKVDGNVDSNELERMSAQMSLHDVFEGGAPQPDVAENLLREKRLLGDANMCSLLELRRGQGNQIVRRTMTVSLSNEAQRSLRVAANLTVPSGLQLASGYERVRKEEYHYTVTVTVQF